MGFKQGIWRAFLALVVCLFLGIGGLEAKEVLKAITSWPKPTTDNQASFISLDILNKKLRSQSPDQLEVKYLGGPEAIKSAEQVQAFQKGVVDICFTTSAYYVSLLPKVDVLKLSPFSPSEEHQRGAWAFMNKLHEERLGVHYLARLGFGHKVSPLFEETHIEGRP